MEELEGATFILRVLGVLRVPRKLLHPCSPTSPSLSFLFFKTLKNEQRSAGYMKG